MRLGLKLGVIVALGLVLGGLLALAVLPDVRDRLVQAAAPVASVGKAQVGGPFTLTDHTGKRVTDADFRGRFMLVYFGFTNCPDVCPTGLQVIAQALDQLGSKADRIVPLFISLDPERDTSQQLADYVKAFHPRLIGLTGTPEQVADAARAYRVYYKKVRDEKSTAGYTLDHTSIIYVMDAKGDFVAHFTHATAVEAIVSRLQKLL
jgi:protein SCO1/2